MKYALAIGKKIKERGYEAVTLTDVDGMKKLCGFPPAMVFMLLERWYGVMTTPENDVMGNVTELMQHYLTGQMSVVYGILRVFPGFDAHRHAGLRAGAGD